MYGLDSTYSIQHSVSLSSHNRLTRPSIFPAISLSLPNYHFIFTKIHPILGCETIALNSINYYPSPVSFISSSLPVLSRFNTTITVIILTHFHFISKDHSFPCPLFYSTTTHYTTGIFNSKGLSMSLHGLQGLDSKVPDARSLINSLASLIEKSDVSTAMQRMYLASLTHSDTYTLHSSYFCLSSSSTIINLSSALFFFLIYHLNPVP